MSSEHLSRRSNWQAKAGLAGQGREETAKGILYSYLIRNPIYNVIRRPNQLGKIYGGEFGIVPDFAVENKVTGKIAFFETKRQGKGGNAHERACKYFAPGLERASAKIAGFEQPFFFIFMNGLTKDRKKILEIKTWFDDPRYNNRYLLWGDRDPETLIKYFDTVVVPCLQ